MIRFDLATMTPDLAVAALRDQKRADKATQMLDSGVLWLYPGYANVRSEKGHGSYVVMNSSPDLTGKWSCSCPDYQYRMAAVDGQCKHIIKARMDIDDWEEPQSEPKATPESVIKLVEKARGDCVFSEEQCGPNAAGRTCINYPFCKADHGRRQQ
jgi:hypothetical protein